MMLLSFAANALQSSVEVTNADDVVEVNVDVEKLSVDWAGSFVF
jgi:hypothetical protein